MVYAVSTFLCLYYYVNTVRTFTFSGKIFLHLQDFVANAQISYFGKIILQTQDFLVNARFFLQMQHFLPLLLWLKLQGRKARKHSRKKMLHLQEKSCIYKKILHLQNNLAKARNLCICNKILQKQEYLSTKCKGAYNLTIQIQIVCMLLQKW